MQQDIERVLKEHQMLDDAASSLEQSMSGSVQDFTQVFRSVSAFANALAEHLLGEDHVLQAVVGKLGESRPAQGQFASDLEALRADWDEYLSVWTEQSAAAQWDLFAEHSMALLARIRRRIARENALLAG